MAESEKKTGDHTSNELEVDSEVTTAGTGYHPGLMLAGEDVAVAANRVEESRSSSVTKSSSLCSRESHDHRMPVSTPCPLTVYDGLCPNDMSLDEKLDRANEIILMQHGFLYKKCKELSLENKRLQRNVAALTEENSRLKDRLKDDERPSDDEGKLEVDSVGGIGQVSPVGKPQPTESIGNQERDVDPLVVHARQNGLGASSSEGEASMIAESQSSDPVPQIALRCQERVEQKKKPQVPSPSQCAEFLAGKMMTNTTNEVLRYLKMTSTDIDDIKAKLPNDQKEQRIEGIRKALSQQPLQERIPSLLGALVKAGLRYEAENFCSKFNIDHEDIPAPAPENAPPAIAQAPSPDPQNKLEEALKPFLKGQTNLPLITEAVKREPKLTPEDKLTFRKALITWKPQQKKQFDEYCVSSSLLGVLNAWASVELKQHSDGETLPEYSIEGLVRSCRSISRIDLLKQLKDFLHTGVAGPREKRDKYLRDIDFSLKNDLIAQLNPRREDGKDWRGLAESVGYNSKINRWESEQMPAERLWDHWISSKNATVGYLYDWARENNRLDIATTMEEEQQAR